MKNTMINWSMLEAQADEIILEPKYKWKYNIKNELE
jgi:hypothetical protein